MSKKYKIGYICGCFDLFHIGHLNIIQNCKKHCDYLIVGICDDDHVKIDKHKDPVMSQEDRKRIISELRCVDEAIIVSHEETIDKLKIYQRVKFDILFNGDDWIGSERSIKAEKDFKELGVEIKYFPYTQGISTSKLIENLSKEMGV